MSNDGGYVLAGRQLNIPITFWDAWIVKVDSAGVEQWNKTFGSIGGDFAYKVINCSDGGYAFTGYTSSYGTNINDQNMWLVKIDSNGTLQWMKTYGGTGTEYGTNVIQTSDGGYMVVGCTDSFGAGAYDVYIVKTDSIGNMQWSKYFGYGSWDNAYGVVETADKGFAVAGYTNSSETDNDGWLIKTDSMGNQLWNKTYGGIYGDNFRDIVSTTSGFAITGEMSPEEGISNCIWLVNVNATGDIIWSRIYKGNTISLGSCLVPASDKGFVTIGTVQVINTSMNALLLIKVDSYGNEQWNQTYIGARYGEGTYMIQTPQGYALTGIGSVYEGKYINTNFWLILTDANGRINYNFTMCTVGQGYISAGNRTYMSGTKVDLVAVPAAGWIFNGWSGDASCAANTTITMDNDKTVTATFTQDKTPTPTPNATATPSPTSYSTPVPTLTSQASPLVSASSSPTATSLTITQSPAPSVPELSLIILLPAVFSAIIAVALKRTKRHQVTVF